MSQIRKVLWAIEGSEPSTVLDYGYSLMECLNVPCVLLHAIEPIAGVDEDVRQFYDEIEINAMRKMTPIVERLRERSIETDPVIVIAPRWESILGHAVQESCDLIILGQPGREPQTPLLGATSYHVLHASRIPVLVIR